LFPTGNCPDSMNVTKPEDRMFPNFPFCNVIKADIITKIDTSKMDENTVHDSFVHYISDSFIPSFNKNSTLARLWYVEPIEVSATLNVTMFGVETKMNSDESNMFVDTMRTVLLGILLNGTKMNEINMNLEEIKILHQQSSTTQRLLASSDGTTVTTNFDKEQFNKVEVLVTTSCARDDQCNDKSLQKFLDVYAPNYSTDLMMILINDKTFFYFDDLQNVIIGKNIIPELPPPTNTNTNKNATETNVEKEKTPVWIIILIVTMCIILISTILYIIVRRSIRRIKGDRIKDGISKDNDDECDEQKNMLRSTPFKPTMAPSFQQIQEWTMSSTKDMAQQQPQQPQQQQRDTTTSSSIFHKRGHNNNKVQEPIYEYEEDDEQYDPRYDNDQFSVEAGNFGDTGYDEQQWNSSFRSYS
jgi:hypothetical protein